MKIFKFSRNSVIFFILFWIFAGKMAFAGETLLDWNEANSSGTNWTGWTWLNDASDWGDAGWRKNDGRETGRGWMPRLHEKTDYDNTCLADVGPEYRAPSTSSGGGMKVYDRGTSKLSAWWFIYENNWGTMGIADSSTNRMSFYFKPNGLTKNPDLTTDDPSNYNFHIGTYLCWDDGGSGGEDCPTEARGQHYYHQLTAHGGTWLHVLLDNHPQHKRGQSIPPLNNPSSPKNYLQYMNTFYVEFTSFQGGQTSYFIDEINLYTTSQPENDISIASVWVGYWPSTDKWEIGWNDGSFSSYGNNSQSTFEIRYSINPITNSNFNSATIINPEYHEYGSTNRVRRPNPWKLVAWTRFELPDSVETSNSIIYFAIKDVSSTANGDGHNAPSDKIHTIDYNLSASTNNISLSPPSNLRVVE